jgi:hypothetical protein
MSSAGRSGMSDTDRINLAGGQGSMMGAPRGMSSTPGVGGPFMPGGGSAPEDQIEVVEIMTAADDADDTLDMGASAFHWWYVPAIGLPVAVGAGAAIWYLAKGQEPYRNARELMRRSIRNLPGQPGLTISKKKTARKARATSDTLRDRVTGALGGLDAAELTGKAGDLWDDARDSMIDLWDQITDRAPLNQARDTAGDTREAARRQLGRMAGNIAAAGAALALQKKASDLADATREKAKAVRAQYPASRGKDKRTAMPGRLALILGMTWLAKNRARKQLGKPGPSATIGATMKAAQVKRVRAAKRARMRVTSPFRRMRTFAFAALVTAMVIYVRSWYTRQSGTTGGASAEDVRETAGGRLVPDTWPRFADGASSAPTATATNPPIKP